MARKITITETREYELHICVECGMEFGTTPRFFELRRSDKRTFFCPNGHQMSWRENEEDRLRRERDRLKQEIARAEEVTAQWRKEAETQKAAAVAAKGVATRLKNRAAAGVCPCCNRSFVQLARHIKTKHPDLRNQDVMQ